MIDGYARALTFAGAVGAGVSAGVFFAFSSFVMTALRRLPYEQGIVAMNAINRAAPNPLFMLVLLGTALVCVVLAASRLAHLGEPGAVWQVVGAGCYVAGVALTIAYHVPRNDALLLVDPSAASAASDWAHYVTGWTHWNHVRTATSLTGAVCLTVALRLG